MIDGTRRMDQRDLLDQGFSPEGVDRLTAIVVKKSITQWTTQFEAKSRALGGSIGFIDGYKFDLVDTGNMSGDVSAEFDNQLNPLLNPQNAARRDFLRDYFGLAFVNVPPYSLVGAQWQTTVPVKGAEVKYIRSPKMDDGYLVRIREQGKLPKERIARASRPEILEVYISGLFPGRLNSGLKIDKSG